MSAASSDEAAGGATASETAPRPSLISRYGVEILIGLGGLLAMNAIFLASAFRRSRVVDATAAGQLGDFVGGYVGTAFLLVSVLLLVATLRAQQSQIIRSQFESKYFALLTLHRDNVTEMRIRKVLGRRVFVLMLSELRHILRATQRVASRHHCGLTQKEIVMAGYYAFFFGIGPNSTRTLRAALAEFDSSFIDELLLEFEQLKLRSKAKALQKRGYTLLDGHQSRLGHYYRHLYQTVRFIDAQTLDIDKYEYAKTVRAQLSTQEQALLLLNSLTPIGRDWWKKELILKYRMVQNIPYGYFRDDELEIGSRFPAGYFEWEEIHKTPI